MSRVPVPALALLFGALFLGMAAPAGATLEGRVKAACRHYVQSRLADFEGDVGVTFYRFKIPANVQDDWTIHVTHPEHQKLAGGVTFKVTMTGGDSRRHRFPVPAKVTLVAPVLVTTDRIARRTALTGDLVTVEERDVTRRQEIVLRQVEQLAGQWNTRTLTAGEILATDDVSPIPAIRSGSRVTIKVAGSGFTVSAPGIAIEDGWIGGRIRVKAERGRKVLSATVVDERTVAPVAFAGGS